MTQSGPSFSLAGLLGLVTLIAIGCAALAARSAAVMYGAVTIAVLVFAAAMLAAFVLQGRQRAVCGGMAIVGWGYLLLTFHPWLSNLGGNLATTQLLVLAWDHVETPDPPRYSRLGENADLSEQYGTLAMRGAFDNDRFSEYARELRTFFFIGQALWAMILGLLGGFVCALLHDWQARRDAIATSSGPHFAADGSDVLQSRSDAGA